MPSHVSTNLTLNNNDPYETIKNLRERIKILEEKLETTSQGHDVDESVI